MARERAPARNAGLPLAEQMIEAHGGAELWERLDRTRPSADSIRTSEPSNTPRRPVDG